jgi:hypothetical protein
MNQLDSVVVAGEDFEAEPTGSVLDVYTFYNLLQWPASINSST